MANLVPLFKSSLIKPKTSSIIKADKLLAPKSSAIVKYSSKSSQTLEGDGILKQIQQKVIKIDNLLKGSLTLSKKESKKKRVSEEQTEFEQREKDLEKNKPKAIPGIKLPSPPKLGIFDWIKNFVFNTLLGFVFVRLYEHLPKLLKLVPIIFKAGEFLIDVGGKLLNGLVTFIDWGYKAIDGTRGFIKNIGGENLAKGFDKFVGAIDTALFLTTALAGSMVIEAMTGDDSGGLMDLLDIKKGAKAAKAAKGATAVGKAATGAAKLGAGAVAGIVAGAGLLASALGEGAFQLRKIATKPLQDKKREFDKMGWFNPKKYFVGAQLAGMNMLLGPISALGVLLDVVGAPFRYAIELLRYPFLSEEDKKKQAYNLAKFDARIREDFRKALNLVTLGFAFKEKGSFGNIYGNKGAQNEMMGKMAGGGRPATRGGKLVGGPAKRTLKKKKAPRTLRATPSKLKPGAAVGGEKNLKKFYPEPEDKKQMSPFGFLKNAYDRFSRSTGLDSLIPLAIKPLMGDKPSTADYKNSAMGINNWMNRTVGSGTLAYAGGGEVKMESIVSGEDYSDVIAKSLQDSIAPQIDKTIQDLMEQMMLKQPAIKEKEPTGEPTTPEGIPLGEGETASGRALMSGLVQRGFTKEEAAAIVGNLWAESGFRTTATNPTSGAFGLMQWLGGRKSRLYAYAAEQGKQVADANLQLDYIKWELKGGNAYETAQFQKAMAYGSSVADKTRGFAYEVERASARELSSSMSKRIGASESVYGGRMVAGESPVSNANLSGGSGRFVQGNSGNSGGIHFHIGPGTQPGQVDTRYNADARVAASKVIKHFLGKKSLYDGRRGASYTTGSAEEIMAAQRAHSASGSQGGIDIQVGGAYDPGAKVPFPFAVGNMAYRPGGFGVSAKINGLNAFVAHGRYDESGRIAKQERGVNLYAFHGMNKVMSEDGLLKYHKGEFISVTDADSFRLVGNILMDINSIENKSQLVAKAPSIIEKLKAISGYTDYERQEPEIQYITKYEYIPEYVYISGQGPGVSGGGGSIDNNADKEILQMV
jgi:hypothetical protein